jgi:hypothetical protein
VLFRLATEAAGQPPDKIIFKFTISLVSTFDPASKLAKTGGEMRICSQPLVQTATNEIQP